MSEKLLMRVLRSHGGKPEGIYSVCSAHPWVIDAALQQAASDRRPVLREATSNQVNQFGSYTGMRPAEFRDFALKIARRLSFDAKPIIFGGDHLGPNPWQHLPAEQAINRISWRTSVWN